VPTYEYKCTDCGRHFEVFQNMTAASLTECEECQGRLKRLIGAGAGVIFKGSGFYCTDYRSDSYQSAAKTDTKTEAKPKADSSSGSSDSGGTKPKATKEKPSAGTAAGGSDT